MYKVYKIYGRNGHRQKESFNSSKVFEFDDDRKVIVLNSDVTGTNEFSILIVFRNTLKECDDELFGQIGDGVFENCATGYIEEVDVDYHIIRVFAERWMKK